MHGVFSSLPVSVWPTIGELTLVCVDWGSAAALPEASDNPAL